MQKSTKRQLLQYAFALGLATCISPSMAQGSYPNNPVRIIVTLPLFRVALNPRFTRPFYAVPRTSAARTASG